MCGSINTTLKCFSLPVLGSKYFIIILERDVFMVIKMKEIKVVDDFVIEGLDKIQLPNKTKSYAIFFIDDSEKNFCVTVGTFHLNKKEYYGFGIGSLDGEKYVIKDLENERIAIFCADNANREQKTKENYKMSSAIKKISQIKSDNYEEFLNKFKEFCSKEFNGELKEI